MDDGPLKKRQRDASLEKDLRLLLLIIIHPPFLQPFLHLARLDDVLVMILLYAITHKQKLRAQTFPAMASAR